MELNNKAIEKAMASMETLSEDLSNLDKLHENTKSRLEHDNDAGQCDLLQFVYDKLKELGHPNPEDFDMGIIQSKKHLIKEDHEQIKNLVMSAQRLVINRTIRLKLSTYDVDSRDARYCLLDEGSYEQWQEMIKDTLKIIVEQYKATHQDTNDEKQETDN